MTTFKDDEDKHLFSVVIRKQILQDKKLKETEQLELAKMFREHLEINGTFYWVQGEFQAYFFCNPEKKLYIVGSEEFRALCHEIYDINSTRALWKYIEQDFLLYISRNGKVTEIHRSSFYDKHNGILYIQNGPSHMFILNGENDPKLIDNGFNGILFRDNKMEEFEPDYDYKKSPAKEYLIDVMNNVVEGKENTIDLYELFIYSTFFESILPTKIFVLITGQTGSGKSSAGRALLKILFGSHGNVKTEPEDRDDFFASVSNSNFVCFDNVDSNLRWMPNVIATTVTGGEHTTRALYTTNDEASYPLKCFLMFTSRNAISFKREDVVDRTLLIELEPRKGKFIAEDQMLEKLLSNRNKIWGEILSNLNKIVAALKDSKVGPQKFRMADFARFCILAAPALKIKNVERTLTRLEDRKSEYTLEDNAIFEGLVVWADSQFKHGEPISSSDLYGAICELYRGKSVNYPVTTCRSFGHQLKMMLPRLVNQFEISHKKGRSNTRLYTIVPKYKLEAKEEKEKKTDQGQNQYM